MFIILFGGDVARYASYALYCICCLSTW